MASPISGNITRRLRITAVIGSSVVTLLITLEPTDYESRPRSYDLSYESYVNEDCGLEPWICPAKGWELTK